MVKKLLQNVSSQRNESLNSTIGSKNPKTRFYGGSESADHRVACAVAQTNLGKQYLSKVLETVHITPRCTTTKQIQKMDYERKQDKIRKQSKEFKKRRKQLRNNRSKKDGQREFREGTVYQSGGALNIDDGILNACNVTANELCNLEQLVSPFCLRRKRTYLFFCPNVEYNFIVYDTETNCGGKKAEIVELSAIAHSTGALFTKFVLPKNGISEHVSKINKFQVVSTGSKKILRRNGIELSTVSLQEC